MCPLTVDTVQFVYIVQVFSSCMCINTMCMKDSVRIYVVHHVARCRLSIIPARSVQMASIPLFILSTQRWVIVCDPSSSAQTHLYMYSIDLMFKLQLRRNNFSIHKGVIVWAHQQNSALAYS